MAGFDGPPKKKGANGNGVGKGRPPVNRQFGKPGGNKPGRPKGISLTRVLREVLEAEGEEAAKARMAKWLKMADEGNQTILREIWDRIDGKVSQPVEVTERVRLAFPWEIDDPSGTTAGPDAEANGDSEEPDTVPRSLRR